MPSKSEPVAATICASPLGGLGVVAGDHLGAARRLEQDHRLHHVGVDAVARRGGLDLVAPGGRPPGAGDGPARALLVEDVRVAERRARCSKSALAGRSPRRTDRCPASRGRLGDPRRDRTPPPPSTPVSSSDAGAGDRAGDGDDAEPRSRGTAAGASRAGAWVRFPPRISRSLTTPARPRGIGTLSPVRTEARFPPIPPTDGHYESFYMKAADPEGGRALWIRHTVHKRPVEELKGAVWITWFDADGHGRTPPSASRRRQPRRPRDAYIRVGESEIAPGRARGPSTIAGSRRELGPDLQTDSHEPLRHLPSSACTSEAAADEAAQPASRRHLQGTLEIDGERIELDAWPGMVGHNWGAEHAETLDLDPRRGLQRREASGYVDIAAGRISSGPSRRRGSRTARSLPRAR